MLRTLLCSRVSVAALLASTSLMVAACGDDSGATTAGSTTDSGPGSGGGSTGSGEGGDGTSSGTTTTSTTASGPTTGTGGASSSSSGGGSTSTGEGAGGSGQGGAGGAGGSGQGGAGGSGQGGAGGSVPECLDPTGCPDPGTDCIERTCDGGVCGTVDVADGVASATQADGDCVQVVCDGAGATRDAIDDVDLPDDSSACTIDVCDAGLPDFLPVAVGTSCGGALLCDGNGNCVGCVTSDDCPGSDDECQTRTCDAGTCGVDFAPLGTVLAAGQAPGNCQLLQCDGAGAAESVADDGDAPPDLEDCVIESCSGGVPIESPIGAGAACDDAGGVLCDGSGACVDCLDDDDCGVTDTCATRTCGAGACSESFAPAGTAVANPVAGDCQRDECDGAGVTLVGVAFDSDLPVDGQQCTGDVCSGGVPTNPNLAINTACTQGGGLRCNGTGTCVECTAGGQCAERVCTGGVCAAAQCNDAVTNGNETGVDCGGPDCGPCANGGVCELDPDCQSGFCNPDLLICETPSCFDGYLNGSETDLDCGGSCALGCELGFACLVDGDCDSNYCFDLFCSTNICGDGDIGPGETCDDGDGIDGNGCDNNCQPSCSNGIIDAANAEICDDGDAQGGDGCSATCQIEASYQCTLATPNVCTRQEVLCTNGADDDGDGQIDAADPDCPWNAQIPACNAGQTLRVYNSVRVPLAIASLATVDSHIFVPPIGTVQRVMIRFNITHTFDGDIDMSLTSPTAVTRNVVNDRGADGDNFQNTRIRQGAATAISAGTAPFNNEFRPEQTFVNFDGALAQGFWRLRVTDDAAGDIGTLNTYSIALCTN